MFRGKAPRALLPLLAAALFALQFFAPAPSFASAHTSRDAVAKAPSAFAGSAPADAALHDETVTCHEPGRSGSTHGPVRVRDRHRAGASPEPEAPEGPPARQRTTSVPEPVLPGRAHERRSRSAADRSPAALQVFRC
ncbi:hypothetical protein [Streptomyces sp. JHA26]|uniref:hypothetical protein n=1 Tax=Streptomyces sp. JHA26 TaxID=1917143 RepID=UPI00098AC468|nr:hypothetical protein [Streptomyces sp. JHA26]